MSQDSMQGELLYSALASDPDLSELVDMYVDEMPDRIAVLKELLSSENWEELRRFAHQMKGAAGSYGFEAVSPIAGAVEDAIRSDAPEDQVRQSVTELLGTCARIRAGVPE